jgi:simple sugar transport system permease protein
VSDAIDLTAETGARSSPSAPSPAPPRPSWRTAVESLRGAGDWFLQQREASVLLVAIGLMLYFYSRQDIFFDQSNLVNIAQATGPTAIVAVGIVLLLINGEIDLSAGVVAALVPFLFYFAVTDYAIPVIPALILSLVIAAGFGFVNGFVVTYFRVPSFVATLGSFFAIRGIMLIISDAYPQPIPEEAKGSVQSWLGQGKWSSLIWALIIVAIFHVVLTQTRWGLHTVSVGGNLVGATEAGIKAHRIKIGNFMIASTLGGFAGLLEAFRINTIDPNIGGGTSLIFFAIAAAVIGGTALAGGSGTVIGALLGALVLAELQNGFNLIGYNQNTIFLITGIAILVSMIANQYLSRLRRAGRT